MQSLFTPKNLIRIGGVLVAIILPGLLINDDEYYEVIEYVDDPEDTPNSEDTETESTNA